MMKKQKFVAVAISMATSAAALTLLLALMDVGPLNTALASEPVRPPARPLAADPGDVMINEFTAKGTEWVELYNTTATTINLDGWSVWDGTGSTPANSDTAFPGGDIGPYNYLSWNTNLSLDNNGATIWLISGTLTTDSIIDQVGYGRRGGAPLAHNVSGYSIARVSDGADTDDDARDWNIDTSSTQDGANDPPGVNLGSSLIINEVNSYSPPTDDAFELYNPLAVTVVMTNWLVTDGDGALVPISGTVPPGGYLVFTNVVNTTWQDVLYVFDDTGVRVDQIGWANEGNEDDTYQRIPDGAGPNDGYDWDSSGATCHWRDLPSTLGYTNNFSPDPFITKAGIALAMPGSLVTYTIAYDNRDGGDSAHQVVITDYLPSGVHYITDTSGLSCPVCTLGATGTLTWEVGTLGVCRGDFFNLTAWVTGTVGVGTTLTNTVEIATSDAEVTTTNNTGQWVTSISALDLVMGKAGPAYAVIGKNVVYAITLNNQGVATATNVILTDTLPVSTTYVSDNSGVAYSNPGPGVYVWSFGDVSSGTITTFNLTVTVDSDVTSGAVLTNTVEASTGTTGDNPANNTAFWTTTACPLVSIHDIQYVDESVGGTFPSDLAGHTVYVEGVVVAASGEVNNDNTYVIEDPAGGPWSGLEVYTYGDQPPVNEGDYVGLLGQVDEYYGMTQLNVGNSVGGQQTVISTTNPLPTPEVLATNDFATGNDYSAEAYESVLIEFQNATVTDPNLGYGEWEFDDGSGPTRADDAGNADSDQTYEPELGDVYNFIRGIGWYSHNNYKLQPRYNADIVLQVAGPAITKDAPVLVAPGELFTYTITVENELGFTLNNVVITDVVPANATFAYALDGGVESGGVVSWTVVSLAHMDSATVRFAVTATTSITTITNANYAVVASNFVTPTAGVPVVTIVDTRLAIHHIQGAGHVSPLVDQDVQNVHGIVTVLASRGFYVQDPNPDSDVATSEAIYVYTGGAPAVVVGDAVVVTGTVVEYRSSASDLSTTEIGNPTVVVSSTGNLLPAATVIGTGGRVPPQQVIDDDATGDVETSGTFDPITDGIDFYESLEAMLVQVNYAVAVGPTSKYGEIPIVGDNGANAGLLTPRGGIVIQPDDFNPERILVDDAIVYDEPDVNTGASFTGPITGVLDYSYGNFKLLNPAPLPGATGGVVSETTTAPTINQLRVASFNVYNLDPGDSVTRCAGLAGQIVDNLQAPDIIGLQEIQDNSGETNDGVVDATATYTTLIVAIQAAGGPTYDFCDISPEDGKDGGAPGGNIRVGFLFRTDRGLTFVDRPGGVATSTTTVTMGVSGVELSYSPGRIDPTNTAFNDSRKPLVGEFIFDGRKMFVVVNHFNSKGGDDALFGHTQPPVLYSEVQRIQQAQVVNDFVDSILALDANANVIVLGDLNDFQFSTPISDTLAAGVLTNLMSTLPITEQYTYLYDGNSQVLDHILVSDNLFEDAYVGFDIVHTNAEFAYSSQRPSDHDPVVATFLIEPDLSIVKEVTPTDAVSLGGVVTYTITLTNSGDGDATGVVMTDVLPSEVDFGGWVQQPTGAVQANDTITWTVEVSAGMETFIAFTATVGTDPSLYGQTVTNTATFASINAGSGFDDAVFTIRLPEPPDLSGSIKTVEPTGSVSASDYLTYTIVLSNSGEANATVTITDTLPGALLLVSGFDGGDLTWSGVVTGGEEVWLTLVAQADPALTADTTVSNVVTINDGIHAPFDIHSPDTTILVPALSIEKSVMPQADVMLGTTITYTIVVSNSGNGDATGVHVTDTLPIAVTGADLDWTGTITANDSLTFTIPAVVTTSTSYYGQIITNTACYSHASGSGHDDAHFTVVRQPFIITITEILQNPKAVNDTDGEWFELYNPGPDDVNINGWTIRDDGSDFHIINNGGPLTITAGSFIVLGRNADSDTNGGVAVAYQYSNFTLGNDNDKIILIDDLGREIDRIEYTGSSPWPDPNGHSMQLCDLTADNNAGSNWMEAAYRWNPPSSDYGSPGALNDCSALSIAKTVVPDTDVALGGTVTYTIIVANSGIADAIGVHVTDTLPVAVTGADLDWTGTVTAAQAVTFTIPAVVTTSASYYGQTITNTTYYAYASGPGSDYAVFTVVGPPVLSIAKSIALTHDPALPGDPITYTIVVRNTGPADAVGVRITDTLPSEVVGADVNVTRTVAAGNAITITVPATVADDAPWGAVVTNTAYYEHDIGSGFDDAVFTIVGPPDLTGSTKAALANDPLLPGDVITYVITLSNTGGTAATVWVTDTVDSPQYLTVLTDLDSLGFTEVTTGTWTFTRTVPAGQAVEVVFAVQVADLTVLPIGQTLFGNDIWMDDGINPVAHARTPSPPSVTMHGIYLPLVVRNG